MSEETTQLRTIGDALLAAHHLREQQQALKSREADLRDTHMRLERMLIASPHGMWEWSHTNGFTWSRSFEKLLGYEAGKWSEMRHPQGESEHPTFRNAPDEVLQVVRQKLADLTYAHYVD